MPEQKIDKAKELVSKLESGVKDFLQSDKYRNYLRTMSKFHTYSFRNNLLIAMQFPTASCVAGYNAWKSKFSRQVQRGAKAIQILAPVPFEKKIKEQETDLDGVPLYNEDGSPKLVDATEKRMSFRAVNVFDVSQTEGKPLPELSTELDGSVEQYDMLFQAIKDVSDAPITIESFESEHEQSKGYYSRTDKSIHIRKGMSEAQTLKTALHEYAHSVLHDDSVEGADHKTKETKEVEAESVAFIVCDHFGVDTSDYTFAYLASWSSDKTLPELNKSLDTIQKTADDVIKKVSARFEELKNKAEKEKTNQEVQTQTQSEHHPAAEEEARQEEKNQKQAEENKSSITGNASYKDIPNKTYVILTPVVTAAVVETLERENIPYACKNTPDGDVVVTISKEHKALVQEIQNTILNPAAAEKAKAAQTDGNRVSVRGNASYKDIPDKTFLFIDDRAVEQVSEALEQAGASYCAKLDAAKGNVFTFSKEHKDLVIQVQNDVLNPILADMPRQTAQQAAKVSATMRFQEITPQQLEVLQAAKVQHDARRSGDKIIIRFPLTEKAKIDAALMQQKSQQIK